MRVPREMVLAYHKSNWRKRFQLTMRKPRLGLNTRIIVDQIKPQSLRHFRRHFDDRQEHFEGKDRVTHWAKRAQPGSGLCYFLKKVFHPGRIESWVSLALGGKEVAQRFKSRQEIRNHEAIRILYINRKYQTLIIALHLYENIKFCIGKYLFWSIRFSLTRCS